MRTSYAHRHFKCRSCKVRFGKVVEISPNETESLDCECGKKAHQEERADSKEHNLFKPFWSDTLQMRIKDRIDLQKLRQHAKDNGLINVGHVHQRPDRAAIRHNYENE